MNDQERKEILLKAHIVVSAFLLGENTLSDLKQVRRAIGALHDSFNIPEPTKTSDLEGICQK